ncbi:sulfotransferase family protein [Rhodanobacter umsongensis]
MTVQPQAHRAILVLGMHRSGTSAVTRVINLLGANLGGDLLPPAADNPSGFWEHRGVVRIHDELLVALGRSWHDLRALPDDWLSSEAAATARKQLVDLLQGEFSKSPLWAVKDPRLCRLLPLWHLVLGDLNTKAHAVFVLRHPDEVAQSLQSRDGMPIEYTRLSWLEHMIEAELASRDLFRTVVGYDNLLRDWAGCMQRLADELALQWPVPVEDVRAEAERFLSPGARHHELGNIQPALPKLAERVYEAFRAKASGESKDWSAIQKVSELYKASADVFLAGLDEVADRLAAAEFQSNQKSVELAALASKLEGLSVASRELDAHTYLHGGLTHGAQIEDLAKVYFRQTADAYSEERSVSVQHEGMYEFAQLKFELPVDAEVDFIRFDPSEFPGDFSIRDLQFNGKPVTFKNGRVSVKRSRIVVCNAEELRIASADGDPNIELDVRDLKPQTKGASVVQLACCRLTPYTELRMLIDSALQKGLLESMAVVTGVVEQHMATVHSRHDDIHALQVHANGLLPQQQKASERLDALDTRFEELAGIVQTISARLVDLAQQHASQCNDIGDHLTSFALSLQQFGSAQEGIQAIRDQQFSGLQERQHQMESHLAGVGKQLDALATLHEAASAQAQAANAQHVLELHGLKGQLDALFELQRRSLIGRIRHKFSKPA